MAMAVASCLLPNTAFAGTKSITRVDDPIVIECKDFESLFKTPVHRLALMARRGESWAPIPFQIDQKKPDGGYAFTSGPEASVDPDPNLDGNDELVFMVKDTGDSAGSGDDGARPKGAGSGVEIEIIDPKNHARGWAYMFRFPGKAPRSDADYIRVEIDRAKQYRKVISYEYVMGGPLDRVYPDMIAAYELPSGKPGLDVLDRLKMRGEAIIIGDIRIPFEFGDMVKAEDMGYIDGPVRVLHLADGYLEFAGFIRVSGQGRSLISYYVNHMIWPMVMEVPMDTISGLIKDLRFHGFLDFNSDVYGSHPFSAANPYNHDVVLDGRMSEAEKNLDRKTEVFWIAGFGPQGAMLNRMFMVPDQPHIKQVTYFLDDETKNDPPEQFPGVTGVGYEIQGFSEELGQPASVSYQYYYYMGKLKPEEVDRILDILDHPVTVIVRPVGPLE
jgi:hypothetical protein